jgi:tetratricopeptide (TPR) repeat protein
LAALALVLGLSALRPALAAPSIWNRARDPSLKLAYARFVAAERLEAHALEAFADPRGQRDFTLEATALFETSGALLGDARLSYLLGDLLLDPLLVVPRARDAQRLLLSALERAPESPLAAQGYFNLAIASAKLGERARERDAYSRSLELETDANARAIIFANRAEASMAQGDLKSAIRDYRRATTLARNPDAQALAEWGLGVALERSGDLPAALAAVDLATSIKLPSPPFASTDALELPNVFFDPDYDLDYYRALGAMSEARHARASAEREQALGEAVDHWTRYLERAEADPQPWIANAKAHRAYCERELAKLKRSRASQLRGSAPARSSR